MTKIYFYSVISFIATIILFVLLNNITGFELHSFTLWFIIPIGAIFVGAGAAAGLFYSHLRYNEPVSGKHYLVGLILGIAALYGIYYVSYLTTYVAIDNTINYRFEGDPISTYEIDGEQITFSKYLELTLQSTEHTSFFKGVPIGSYETGETVNKIYFYLQFLGAAIGGLVIGLTMLGSKKFCDKCKKYYKEQSLFKFSVDEYESTIEKLNESIEDPHKFKTFVKEAKLKEKSDADYIKVKSYASIDLEYCPSCFDSFLLIKVMALGSESSFEEVDKLRQTINIPARNTESIILLN